jgi:hypothetical protein
MKVAQIEPEIVRDRASSPQRDPLEVLREVLELQRESFPTLNVEQALAFAIKNPTSEVVDSLGAVSVVCAAYGAYDPDTLIPDHLLTHENFSTLNGLKRVLKELDKRQAKK